MIGEQGEPIGSSSFRVTNKATAAAILLGILNGSLLSKPTTRLDEIDGKYDLISTFPNQR